MITELPISFINSFFWEINLIFILDDKMDVTIFILTLALWNSKTNDLFGEKTQSLTSDQNSYLQFYIYFLLSLYNSF